MTKGKAVNLYQVINDFISCDLGENTYAYAKLRIELRKHYSEYKELYKELKKQAKTDDAFKNLIDTWAEEESEINAQVLTFENVVDLCVLNKVHGSIQDELITLLTK